MSSPTRLLGRLPVALTLAVSLSLLTPVVVASADESDPSPSAPAEGTSSDEPSPSSEPSTEPSTEPSAEPSTEPSTEPSPDDEIEPDEESERPDPDEPDFKQEGTPAGKAAKPYTPATGATFNSPFVSGGRTIATKVIKSINNTAKGEKIRIAIWNFDDGPTADALINAKRRGVDVRVITAHTTANPTWKRLRNVLTNGGDSYARACRYACRSTGPTLHSKLIMFTRIHKKHDVTMVGSLNLTAAAATNQWNDLLTVTNPKVYDYLLKRFIEYSKDKPVKSPYAKRRLGADYQVTMYPANHVNPVVQQLNQVRCWGAKKGYGSNGRTIIRIAVAAWFDSYGQAIANKVRALWNQGCDIRIVTTLAGGGINKTLKSPGGRGPIPIKQLTIDSNGDGVPEKYLHMKSMSINGHFGPDRSAAIVLTGSPNWATDGRRADELVLRVREKRGLMRAYQNHISRLFNAPSAHYRTAAPPSVLMRGLGGGTDNKTVPPGGFELN